MSNWLRAEHLPPGLRELADGENQDEPVQMKLEEKTSWQ